MSKVINITDKLSSERPSIQVGEKNYELNDSMEVVLRFEEMGASGNQGVLDALKMALGDKAYKELKVDKMSVQNFKVLTIAIIASMQGLPYEEAEARFQRK